MAARPAALIPVITASVIVAALAALTAAHSQNDGALPVDAYLADLVRLQLDERSALRNGAPITRLLPTDQGKDIGVLGAVWVAAPIRRYVDAVSDIERLKSGPGFRVVKRLSDPPALSDFSQWQLPDEDFEALHQCRIGDCDVKLDEPALRQLQTTVNWRADDARANADALIRQVALGYVNGYREGGAARLPVYRDQARPISVGSELRDMIGRMPSLNAVPDVRRFLLEFPAAPAPNIASFLYWQKAEFGLKPTLSIHHVAIREAPDATVVTTKMLYASHYFWTGIELRTLVPDPARGEGFWFVAVTRSRSDGLGGFTGSLVRRRVASAGRNATLAELRATKRLLEAVH